MPAGVSFVRGNSDFGRVISDADVSLADTGESGVPIALEVDPLRLYSAQSKMPVSAGISQLRMRATPTIINLALRNLARALIEDAAFSGDLEGAPATAEVFNFRKDTIGESEGAIYSEGAGPLGSVRRVAAPRVVLVGLGALNQGKTEWMQITPEYETLDPGLDDYGAAIHPLTVTDTPA